MKSKRHAKILEIIGEHAVETQEELQQLLNESGFSVTQATVSRDIKELRLVKSQTSAGGYRYTTGITNELSDMSFRFHAIFSESVKNIDRAMNIVVIKCYTGMANAACAALDSIQWDGLVGTIAGDDTIFSLTRDEETAMELMEQLKALAEK